MAPFWLIVLVAAAGGAAVALQAQLVGVIDDRAGTLAAVVVTYGAGGLLAGGLMLVMRGVPVSALRDVPPYAYLSGALGLIVIGAISWGVARLGVVRGLLVVTLAQFLLGAMIDQFGWFGADIRVLDLPKVVGIGFLLLGGWLVLH